MCDQINKMITRIDSLFQTYPNDAIIIYVGYQNGHPSFFFLVYIQLCPRCFEKSPFIVYAKDAQAF